MCAASGIYGITPDEQDGLYGISEAQDLLVRIDADTAHTEAVGPLGVDFQTHGATLSASEQSIYAIRGVANELYEVDVSDGSAQLLSSITGADFEGVGIERHPDTDQVFGCTDGDVLYEVDVNSGQATSVGSMGAGAKCTNLGAPWETGPTVCVPAG